MTTEPAIACTLTPAEMEQRATEVAGLNGTLAALTVRFAPGDETLRGVEAFVAAESRCCAFFDFAIEPAAEATTLTIAAPEGAEPILAELAAHFASTS
jgi:hypothetical protein